jgi:pyruvate dehydrogenase E2 component (dihydrolipoamide acetyltransferase)
MGSDGLAVSDFVVKAAAGAMKVVPDCNGQWMGSFVRQYQQVDINMIMGGGAALATPVLRDVGSMGVGDISAAVAAFEDSVYDEDGSPLNAAAQAAGTFSIHNLGGHISHFTDSCRVFRSVSVYLGFASAAFLSIFCLVSFCEYMFCPVLHGPIFRVAHNRNISVDC